MIRMPQETRNQCVGEEQEVQEKGKETCNIKRTKLSNIRDKINMIKVTLAYSFQGQKAQ